MTAWYRTGTVTATNGSGTVTGNLTAWLANAKVGDVFYPDADSKGYEITAVGSNTSITISPVYAGTTGSGKAYGIARTSTAWNSASELSVQIAQFISTFDPLGLSQLSDPNADRIPFWDESSGTAGAMAWLTLSGLGISGTTMSVDANLISTARWPTSTLVAATTTDIGSEAAPLVTVSGNTGITSFGNQPNRFRIVRFTGTPTITHNGTTLILPGAVNLSVLANSVHVFASDASGNWRWLWSNDLSLLTTAAGRALLDDATAADQLTTLGVSAYAKTLLDDANAAEAQATLGVRAVLTAGRTYYVRTDGSDSNNGLADTSGGAFLTIQKALDVVGSLDIGIYNVVISVGAGTFSKTGTNVLKAPLGSGTVTIQGAGMANTTVSHTSGECFYGEYTNFRFTVRDMKLQTTTSGSCLYQFGNGLINYRGIDFGSAVTAQVRSQNGGQAFQTGNCTISGGASYHILCSTNSIVDLTARTLTLSGTPAFSFAFISVVRNAFAVANSVTFSGSATGPRHYIDTGGIVFTNGATEASYFPGNSAGTTTAPGAFL